jgi:hypothetical protein
MARDRIRRSQHSSTEPGNSISTDRRSPEDWDFYHPGVQTVLVIGNPLGPSAPCSEAWSFLATIPVKREQRSEASAHTTAGQSLTRWLESTDRHTLPQSRQFDTAV